MNPMPLIHRARRTYRNRMDGNPFATDARVEEQIAALAEAYTRTRSSRSSNLLKVEIDRLESLI